MNGLQKPKYLIHIEETSKKEFDELQNVINEEIQNKYKNNEKDPVSIKIEKLPMESKAFSEIKLQPISFSNNLNVTNSAEIGNLSYCNKIYYLEENGNYRIIRIEPLHATNNTDPTGPKVQQPLNQTGILKYKKELFRKLTKIELDAAENNVESNNQKKDKYFYPVVAILDTGIDLGVFKQRINSQGLAPLHFYKDPFNNNKVIGRNFFNGGPYGRFPNEPFDNDGYTKHGTRVAKLIAEITENQVRIMTLKTASHKGIHNLIDIYSAFEYILMYNSTAEENDKVKIINASWSFESECRPLIFEYYLKKLIADGVQFVTTSGNKKREIKNIAMNSATEIQLYPALYKDKNDILVVGDNSAKHGYSDVYVNCCVNGDKSGHYKDVLLNITNDKLFGTSFAAAIYSGYLAKYEVSPFDAISSTINSQILY